MSATRQQCRGCSAKVRDGYLCAGCTRGLREAWAQLPVLVEDLALTAYKQDRIAPPGGGYVSQGERERPLSFKIAAAALLSDVMRHIAQAAIAHGVKMRDERGRRTTTSICRDLHALAQQDATSNAKAAALLNVIATDVTLIRAMIDLPAERRYLGNCDECGTALYADRAETMYGCPTKGCPALYVVDRRIDELLVRSRDVIASPATIARALTSLEVPVTDDLIRKWKERGLLTPRPSPGRHPWYRVGDVLDLLVSTRRRGA